MSNGLKIPINCKRASLCTFSPAFSKKKSQSCYSLYRESTHYLATHLVLVFTYLYKSMIAYTYVCMNLLNCSTFTHLHLPRQLSKRLLLLFYSFTHFRTLVCCLVLLIHLSFFHLLAQSYTSIQIPTNTRIFLLHRVLLFNQFNTNSFAFISSFSVLPTASYLVFTLILVFCLLFIFVLVFFVVFFAQPFRIIHMQ